MAPALISIYSIFIVFFVSSAIKNLVVNANGYSRFLRILIFLVVFGYLAYVGFLAIRPIVHINNMTWKLEDSLSIITFFIITIISLGTLIVMDYKKASVRDLWKYQAIKFENFKTDKPTDFWKLTFKSIVLISVLISMAIGIAIIFFAKKWYVWTSTSLLISHIVVNYLLLGLTRNNLLNKNTRYNLLKDIIFNHNSLEENTKKEVGKKMMQLYNCLFICSWFYKRKTDTNNAILYEIFRRTGFKPNKQWRYFKDPHTKRSISIETYENDYEKKE